MKRYVAKNNIQASVFSAIFFLITLLFIRKFHWPYTIACVLSALACSVPNIPNSKDLGFIASSNASLSEYMIQLFVRNLWFHGFCLIVSILLANPSYDTILSFDVIILMLLMLANSVVILGVRLSRYRIIILYCAALVVGAFVPVNSYLIIVGLVVSGLAYERYSSIILSQDLV